ncbi:MAG: diguanylate cyclase [Acidobacteria bacterium]|nr:diguanylate cyclase [Acidobacteriota bacterium]MBI3486804.1 diguanylate cyclase [Acidobacteriota bacterium]
MTRKPSADAKPEGEAPLKPKLGPKPVPMETLPGFPEMATVVRSKAEGELQPAPPEWALVAYAGAALGRVFPLTGGTVIIGRAPDAGVTLLDGEVSRHHARIRLEEGQVQVEDLGSTNGTRVNGEAVHGPRSLKAGDRLSLGGHVLKVVCLDSLERAFHETLLDLSTKDPLTGLANRGSSLAEFQNRFGLSLRYGRPLSVVVCDLDHFKQVNDTFGHGAGDVVLRIFGERLLTTLREADLAGRIGGEEFLMVLPETDLAGARPFAERLRRTIASMPISLASGPLNITCSLGIAERAASDLEAGQLLARADAALYRAKAGGRNLVCEG